MARALEKNLLVVEKTRSTVPLLSGRFSRSFFQLLFHLHVFTEELVAFLGYDDDANNCEQILHGAASWGLQISVARVDENHRFAC